MFFVKNWPSYCSNGRLQTTRWFPRLEAAEHQQRLEQRAGDKQQPSALEFDGLRVHILLEKAAWVMKIQRNTKITQDIWIMKWSNQFKSSKFDQSHFECYISEAEMPYPRMAVYRSQDAWHLFGSAISCDMWIFIMLDCFCSWKNNFEGLRSHPVQRIVYIFSIIVNCPTCHFRFAGWLIVM